MRSESVHPSAIYDRAYLLATAVLVYVTLAACQQVGFGPASLVLLGAGPAALAAVWRGTRRSLGSALAYVEPAALRALRWCAWGAALWGAARLRPGWPLLDLAALLGLGSACVGGAFALARIPASPGLMQPPAAARSLDAALFCGVFWGIAGALGAGRAFWPGSSRLFEPVAADYASQAACIASLLVFFAAALRLGRVRRLELWAFERARAALLLSLAALAATVPAAAGGGLPPEWALPLGALAAALGCAWASTTSDAASLSRRLRRGALVLVLGAPLALGALAWARSAPQNAPLIVACGLGAGLLLGMWARGIQAPLGRAEARRLRAYEAASRAALEPEPATAVLATLERLQDLEQALHARPELFRVDPPEVLSVDLAGYLHTERGAAPPDLYELAGAEPERLLRREVLAALEVRRPSVRPALAWMDARQAFAAVLISEEQNPLGLLLLPGSKGRGRVTLCEARAARTLADRLGAVLSVSSALERARVREANAAERAEQLQQERQRLENLVGTHTRHRDSVVEVLAGSVRVAAYGTRMRRALQQLELLAAAGRDVGLELPVGVDALAWACAFHLASGRRKGPLVICDATTAVTHAASYWSPAADAPTRRAEGGTLVVLQLAALPLDSQDALAKALAQRSSKAPVPPCVLLATFPQPPEHLLEQRQLLPALAELLVPHALRVPALRERGEDLRGLVLDRLLRSGVRHLGQPLGIDRQALARMVEHDWPGNDAELRGVLDRAARLAQGPRLGVADLAAAGFAGTPAEPDPLEHALRTRSERVRKANPGMSQLPSSAAPPPHLESEPSLASPPGLAAEPCLEAQPSPRSSPRRRRRR